jgi:hypothetical protein
LQCRLWRDAETAEVDHSQPGVQDLYRFRTVCGTERSLQRPTDAGGRAGK